MIEPRPILSVRNRSLPGTAMQVSEFIAAVVQRIGAAEYGLLAFIWSMTLLGLAYTFLCDETGPKTLPRFLRFCLPWHVVTARQTRLDLFYALTLKAVRPLWR